MIPSRTHCYEIPSRSEDPRTVHVVALLAKHLSPPRPPKETVMQTRVIGRALAVVLALALVGCSAEQRWYNKAADVEKLERPVPTLTCSSGSVDYRSPTPFPADVLALCAKAIDTPKRTQSSKEWEWVWVGESPSIMWTRDGGCRQQNPRTGQQRECPK